MKNTIAILLLFIAFKSNCQEYKSIYLGKDGFSYKGLQLIFKEGSIGGTRYHFYSALPQKNYQRPVYGRTKEYDFVTDTNTLKNRIFLVEDVLACEFCIDNSSEIQDYIFKLNDGKEIIYYIYKGDYEGDFPFLVKGFSYSKTYLSKYIKKEVDEFEGEIIYRTPLLNDISLTKVIKNGKSAYYLSLETRGATLNSNEKGVVVLFTDGTKWTRPNEKIDVKVVEGTGWGYRAFVQLNSNDLSIFSNKVVKKFRLYIYDNENPDDVEKFPLYVQSIIDMK